MTPSGFGAAALLTGALAAAFAPAPVEAALLGSRVELMSAYTVVHYKRKRRHHEEPREPNVSTKVNNMVKEMCKKRPDHPSCAEYTTTTPIVFEVVRDGPAPAPVTAAAPVPVTTTAASQLVSTTAAAVTSKQVVATSAAPVVAREKTSFDCDEGKANWKDLWSHDKKVWCCDHHQIGCYEAPCSSAPCGEPFAAAATRAAPTQTAATPHRDSAPLGGAAPSETAAAPHGGSAPKAGGAPSGEPTKEVQRSDGDIWHRDGATMSSDWHNEYPVEEQENEAKTSEPCDPPREPRVDAKSGALRGPARALAPAALLLTGLLGV